MSYPADTRETFVSIVSAASTMVQLPNALIDTVNVQREEGPKGVGDTVNILVPTVTAANATDIGSGDLVYSDVATGKVPVTLSSKMSSARIIRSFDQTRSGIRQMAEVFVKPAIEEVYQKLNTSIAALITSANFTTNGSIQGGTDNFTRNQIAQGWAKLLGKGVPVQTPGDLFFATHTDVYGNMASSTEFVNEAIVGVNAAEKVQQFGLIVPQYGAKIFGDPAMPIPTTGLYAGLLYHRGAITARTAVEYSLANAVISEYVLENKKIPVKVQMTNDMDSQGVKFHASALVGLAVTRPEFAQFYLSQ